MTDLFSRVRVFVSFGDSEVGFFFKGNCILEFEAGLTFSVFLKKN